MVCLGNICRSPLAEGIMKHKCAERGLNFEVDSAGTGAWHAGELPDPRSIAKADEYGIELRDQRARQFRASDFKEFDKIFVMDASNYQNVVQLANTEADKAKVSLMLEEIPGNTGGEVPDPYYGGESGFENVYQLLDMACDHFLEKAN